MCIRDSLRSKPKLMEQLPSLRGTRLICQCESHEVCHGDRLAKMINECDEQHEPDHNPTKPKKIKWSKDADINNALMGEDTPLPPATADRIWPKPQNLGFRLLKLPILIILLLYAGPAGPGSLEAAIQEVAPHLSQYVVPLDLKSCLLYTSPSPRDRG